MDFMSLMRRFMPGPEKDQPEPLDQSQDSNTPSVPPNLASMQELMLAHAAKKKLGFPDTINAPYGSGINAAR